MKNSFTKPKKKAVSLKPNPIKKKVGSLASRVFKS